MKKMIFVCLVIFTILGGVVLNMNVNAKADVLSDVSLGNIQALAKEDAKAVGCCPQGGFCMVIVNGVIVYCSVGECPCSNG